VEDAEMDDFIKFAAGVLGVPGDALTPETAYGSLEEWDSVMHLRLVMETEARYGSSIPLAEVPRLRTLADFSPYIRPEGNS
jgi:acyl carrier protein